MYCKIYDKNQELTYNQHNNHRIKHKAVKKRN